MSNIIETLPHPHAAAPSLLTCKICGEEQKIPVDSQVWIKHEAKIEKVMKDFKELHEKCI